MIKAALVLAVALGAARLLRRRQAALRHRLLATAIVCAALLPLAEQVAPAWHLPILPAGAAWPAPSAAQLSDAEEAPGQAAEEVPPGRSALHAVFAWLPSVWAAGAAIGFLVLAASLRRAARIASRARRVEDRRWTTPALALARQYGLSRPPVLLQATEAGVLFTWGLLRPVLLLPAGARTWSDERIRIVLGHELAHIRRHDWAVQLLAHAARCFHWFNPLMWVACRRLRLESEHACDDEVLRLGVAPPDYASELVTLAAAFTRSARSFSSAPAMAQPSELERRIRVMLNPRLDRAPLGRTSTVLVWLGMFTLMVATAGLSLRGGEAAALVPGDAGASLSSVPQSSAAPAAPRTGLSQPTPAPQARDVTRPRATPQTASAGISGTVKDQTGRSIPGVPVVVTDGASTVAETVTDQEGRFEVTSLAPGRYQLRISKPGFRTLVPTLVVRAGETGRLEGVLQLGMLSETVVVAAGTGSPAASRAPRARHAGVAASDDPCAQSTAGGCVTPPRKLVDAKPVYPSVHARAGLTGEVVIGGVLKPDGKLAELQPQPDADPDFAAAAIHAIRLWEFSPTRLNGEPVDVQVRVTVKFGK